MKKENLEPNLYYIHTTHKIIPYVDRLSRKFFPNRTVFHLMDEGILKDIEKNLPSLAQKKIENLIEGGISSGANKFVITCTATGNLIVSLEKKYRDIVKRIELSSIEEIKKHTGSVGVVYTNPPAWIQISKLMKENGIAENRLIACFIPDAFTNLLAGKIEVHDLIVTNFLKNNQNKFSVYFLAQVSICSIAERINSWGLNIPVISMAEVGIIHLDD